MLRASVAGLLVLAALASLSPPAQAVYVCQVHTDAADFARTLGRDPLLDEAAVHQHCSTENILSRTCKEEVKVHYDGSVSRTLSCQLFCNPYCPPPPAATTSAAASPCYVSPDTEAPSVTLTCSTSPAIGYDCHTTAWADRFGVHRDYIECDPLLYCVTDPCPGGGTIRI
jgi:hypothetical protein